MDYKNKQEVIEIINKEKQNYNYLWVNTYSDLYLKDVSNEDKKKTSFLNDESLIEAKLFNEGNELSIVKTNKEDEFSVVKFNEKDYEGFVQEEQVLNQYNLKDIISKLIIRHYFKYDEDGQAYVAYTKLCEIKEEKQHEQKWQ